MASKDAKKLVLSSFITTKSASNLEKTGYSLKGKFLSEGSDVFVISPNRRTFYFPDPELELKI